MITASPEVLAPIAKAHQFLTFTTPPQPAGGRCLRPAEGRRLFQGAVSRHGSPAGSTGRRPARYRLWRYTVPGGTYFLTTDFRPLGYNGSDAEFCKYLTVEAGVAAVPVGAFYTSEETGYFARFSFCKREETIDEALRRLKSHFR